MPTLTSNNINHSAQLNTFETDCPIVESKDGKIFVYTRGFVFVFGDNHSEDNECKKDFNVGSYIHKAFTEALECINPKFQYIGVIDNAF